MYPLLLSREEETLTLLAEAVAVREGRPHRGWQLDTMREVINNLYKSTVK